MKKKLEFLVFFKYIFGEKHFPVIRKPSIIRFLIQGLILTAFISSCNTDPFESKWVEEESLSISQYVEKNRDEYSKFYRLMMEGKMLTTLYAYNPYGNDYTLFLPTNEALDMFIQQNQKYSKFEELVSDTSFIKIFTRYHTLNSKMHTDQFPDGAILDTTLTGDRLVTGFFTKDNNQLIKVNNSAHIVKANLKMVNGYVHVISGVLQKAEISGYDWLQQQDGYSILAEAVRLSGIRTRLWWDKYTILAEHDSIYHRHGIRNVDDLIARIATPGMPLTNVANPFHLFTAYHFLRGEFYLNDFFWGNRKYTTLSGYPMAVNVGMEIKINQGADIYGYQVSNSGDTTLIDYIRPYWENCNVMSRTGAIHSISDLLSYKPFPKK